MATNENDSQIIFMLKFRVKELVMHTAEKEGISLNHMCQILIVEALAARSRKKRAMHHHY